MGELKIVDYILVAEFDIDKGSTIAFQYPEATGEDTQLLAELMLPDGAHKRDEDWTVFFLRRQPMAQTSGVGNDSSRVKKSLTKDDIGFIPLEAFAYEFSETSQSGGWDSMGSDKKQVILLTNGIKIVSKDGELVSMIEKHPNLDFTQLEPLFSCILTESGTALGLRFTSPESENLFIQHVQALVQQIEEEKKAPKKEDNHEKQESKEVAEEVKPFLYCLNLVINQKDNTVRRGAVVKAMAVCSRFQCIHIFKPVIMLALQKFYISRSEETLAECYEALNAMDMSGLVQYPDYKKQIMRATGDKSKTEFTTQLKYSTKLNIKIPLTLFPDEVGDYKVTSLVKKFGSQVMIIYNGLLSQKRILFLGFDCSAIEVCEYVLACIQMVCPPLKNIIQRAFPYTNLTYLDFLSVPGYIAGATNPIFETHQEWWDILCNINTGKITVSAQIQQQLLQNPEKHASCDVEFMNTVNTNISSHYGEDTIRSLFQNYTQHIADMAFDEEEFPDEATRQSEIENNRPRIIAWKQTLTYKTYDADRRTRREISAIRDPLVQRYIKKLRICKNISELEMVSVYQTFLDNVFTEDQLLEFLSFLPESGGGLIPVAISLFHSSETVRIATARLLKRLEKTASGAAMVKALNQFLHLGYERVSKLLKDE